MPTDYHASPSSFTLPVGTGSPGIQSVTFALPSAPMGGFASGTITRVFDDLANFWFENFSTAGGSDAYDNTSAHQCGFPLDAGSGVPVTQTVALTTQQLADLTAAAGGTITCSVNHTSTTPPGPVYHDLYLTLTPGAAPPLPGEPGTYFEAGYQATPLDPADEILEPAGTERFVTSGSGSAALTAMVDLGAGASVGTIDWIDGTAASYGAVWEHSNDAVTWTALTMPTPPIPSGSFAWGNRSLTLGAPVTARYWRLSVEDTPGGSAIGVAGIKQITLQAPSTGAPVKPVDDYCGDSGSFSISGTWKRSGGITPHKHAWLSLFYKTCRGPMKIGNAHGIAGSYCSDGDIHVVTTQTDCTGAYAFSVPGSILSAGVAVGKYVPSPDWAPDAPFSPTDAAYNGRIASQWILDPATAANYGCCHPQGTHWVYPANYIDTFGGDSDTNAFYRQDLYFAYEDTDATVLYNDSSFTPCGDAWLDGNARPRQNMPSPVFQLWRASGFGSISNYPRSTPLKGTFVFDFRSPTGSVPSGLDSYITKDGKWYHVANTSYEVEDACGTIETTTYDAGTFGNGFSSVDWPNLTRISLTSAMPSCGFRDGYPSPDDPNIWGPVVSPLVQNVFQWKLDTDFTPIIAGRCVCNNLTLVVVMEDCSNPPTPLKADVYQATRTLAVAWTNVAGKLITAVHRSPLAHIEHSAEGWEANQILEAANASDQGFQYLRTARAYVDYALSGGGRYRSSDFQGAGPSTNWSAAAGQTYVGAGAAGRSPLEDWRFVLIGGAWHLVVCRDNRGVAWIDLATASAAAAAGSGCGGAWIGTGYGLLYNRSTDGHAVFRKTQKPDDWSTATDVDLGTSRIVAGMVQMPTGTLVGMLYDPANQRCRACQSRDHGATWHIEPIFTEFIPELTTPPALVNLDFALLAVWQTGDQPQFAVSVDEGGNWT